MSEKRTYADRNKDGYMVKAVAKRRQKIKSMSIEYKGSKCQLCGYDKCVAALEFHHTGDKAFQLSDGYTRSWAKVMLELNSTVLLCANCHREVEAGLTPLYR
jgi:hypothetical protein